MDEHEVVRPGEGASMTLGEAEAWRAGWRAAIEAAAAWHTAEEALTQNLANRRVSEVDAREWQLTADYHRAVAAAIRALPMRDPRPEPSGWSYRG